MKKLLNPEIAQRIIRNSDWTPIQKDLICKVIYFCTINGSYHFIKRYLLDQYLEVEPDQEVILKELEIIKDTTLFDKKRKTIIYHGNIVWQQHYTLADGFIELLNHHTKQYLESIEN